jgi:hypothetical protein
MSRYGIERACYDLRDEANRRLFKATPEDFLARYPLSPEERAQIMQGDVGALFAADVAAGAIGELMRTFDYDMATYVAKVRETLRLPPDESQLAILRARAGGRKRFT